MNDPLVSIIIPLYNTEKYIEKAINSVINQTYKNWQLIVIDDCSTDDSLNIVLKISTDLLKFKFPISTIDFFSFLNFSISIFS